MKKFLIMGTINTASYKDLYEVLLKRKLLIGYNKNKIIFKNDLNEDKGVPNIYWYTNMKHIYKDSLKLNYYKDESKIYKYDNKDYYGVDFIRHTPDNYYKEIGLPVTFLWYDNLKDYELIDIVREYYNGKELYIRILVKRIDNGKE